MCSIPTVGSSDMFVTSHRLKTEERKLVRKLLTILLVFSAFVLLFIYAGLPLLAQIIVAITSINQKNESQTQTDKNSIIFPPILDRTYDATNSSAIRISGWGEKESTVKIILNNQEEVKVLTDKDGRFQTGKIQLKEGENMLAAINIIKNRESSPSASLSITYKKSPPLLEIETPKDGDKFSPDNKDIFIRGLTDPGNRITINDRLAIVSQDGRFNYAVNLSDGENKFKITASDAAGNQTTIEIIATLEP